MFWGQQGMVSGTPQPSRSDGCVRAPRDVPTQGAQK